MSTLAVLQIVPIRVAAARLHLSIRTLKSRPKRLSLGLVDAPPPSGGGPRAAWLTAESLDRVAAARAAIHSALRAK